MASLNHIVLGILILQIYAHAAPSDVSKLEDIAQVEQKLDSEPKEVENDNNSTETQRQKRWYNPYGFPPINPLIYPSINKRDEGANTGYYGGEDPITQIHRQIQEIAQIVRQPPPPPLPHIPIFYPVLFIPPSECNCNHNPTTPDPDTPITPNNNDTTPSVVNRWPVMEDERQNWGLVVNETNADEDKDYSRPISFDPIKSNRPIRPPPPVEHGSVQSDSTNDQDQPQSLAPSPPVMTQTSPPPQNSPPSGLAPPSPCDGAILTCCHQPLVVYDCFAIQGCPDFTAYGDPCDPNLILRVIDRFQTYYGSKTG